MKEEKYDFYNPETKKWEEIQSGNLYVGDIISVLENETFPADIILLDSCLPEGICYIKTGTLDSEKTLIKRISVSIFSLFISELPTNMFISLSLLFIFSSFNILIDYCIFIQIISIFYFLVVFNIIFFNNIFHILIFLS